MNYKKGSPKYAAAIAGFLNGDGAAGANLSAYYDCGDPLNSVLRDLDGQGKSVDEDAIDRALEAPQGGAYGRAVRKGYRHLLAVDRFLGGASGSITWAGDHFTVGLLTDLRTGWRERTREDRFEEKLVFVLGWLTHRAADLEMKSVFRGAEPLDTY